MLSEKDEMYAFKLKTTSPTFISLTTANILDVWYL